VLFQILDPKEIQPRMNEAVVLVDMETNTHMEVTPDYLNKDYRERIDAHIEALRDGAKGAGMDYYLLVTDKPLDGALSEYLTIRQGRD
jgi:hypothetical protein